MLRPQQAHPISRLAEAMGKGEGSGNLNPLITILSKARPGSKAPRGRDPCLTPARLPDSTKRSRARPGKSEFQINGVIFGLGTPCCSPGNTLRLQNRVSAI